MAGIEAGGVEVGVGQVETRRVGVGEQVGGARE